MGDRKGSRNYLETGMGLTSISTPSPFFRTSSVIRSNSSELLSLENIVHPDRIQLQMTKISAFCKTTLWGFILNGRDLP